MAWVADTLDIHRDNTWASLARQQQGQISQKAI